MFTLIRTFAVGTAPGNLPRWQRAYPPDVREQACTFIVQPNAAPAYAETKNWEAQGLLRRQQPRRLARRQDHELIALCQICDKQELYRADFVLSQKAPDKRYAIRSKPLCAVIWWALARCHTIQQPCFAHD